MDEEAVVGKWRVEVADGGGFVVRSPAGKLLSYQVISASNGLIVDRPWSFKTAAQAHRVVEGKTASGSTDDEPDRHLVE